MTPDEAAGYLTKLSALYGSVLEEISKKEATYLNVLRLAYDSTEKANRAKILAMNDPSYQDWQIARNYEKLTLELIRSIKFFLKTREQEYKL